jgi:hypothetical protein
VTDTSGRFAIPSLPPGTYTVEAWHERLGVLTGQVSLDATDTKTLTFTYRAS